MRPVIIASAFAALAFANPLPQDMDLGAIDALPQAEVSSAPVDVSSQVVAVKPVSDAVLEGAAAVNDVAAPDGVARKRDLVKRDCEQQPLGYGPNSKPDTADAFLADPQYNKIASKAPTPQGYTLAFSELKGSTHTTSYLDGCIAFNIYIERDPTVDPGYKCSNPPSTINYKCAKWGVQIKKETATNTVQYRKDFRVVISGSNGYNKRYSPEPCDKYNGPVSLEGAMQAPLDPVTKTDTYMGYKFFSFDDVKTYEYGVVACTSACTAQSKYNLEHPPSSGHPAICNQVVVYVLSQSNKPQGIYCSMYTEVWAPNHATNYGQWRGSEYWSVSQAYSYSRADYDSKYPKAICDVGGCPADSYKGGNWGGWGSEKKCKSKRSKTVTL
ncbi:uncharacterized protein EAF02_002438 [Botrytis sinoallii]|uniref:uncharacterized protein n=1 Tax=Botrytis sinoallii TaxID=1463999 RepID=UPI001902AB8E|nr:uncharacterized protein EAF02_002438 [Botrytis sinoallii]KAF7890023.1 hypothetical protein EAF02_002438 [Botrytis sinoallii]